MKFICEAGLHEHRTEQAADHCYICRRIKDARVNQHFLRESKRMLTEQGIDPKTIYKAGRPKE